MSTHEDNELNTFRLHPMCDFIPYKWTNEFVDNITWADECRIGRTIWNCVASSLLPDALVRGPLWSHHSDWVSDTCSYQQRFAEDPTGPAITLLPLTFSWSSEVRSILYPCPTSVLLLLVLAVLQTYIGHIQNEAKCNKTVCYLNWKSMWISYWSHMYSCIDDYHCSGLSSI